MLENALNHVAAGVFAYGRHSPTVGTEKVVVLVHPFFGKEELKTRKRMQLTSRDWSPSLMRDIQEHKRYIANVKSLIAESHHPIVTFEEEPVLERTVARYRKIAGEKEWYFIPTRVGDPTPLSGDWRGAIGFLKSFEPEQVILGGGFLNGYPGPENRYTGCLGYTVQKVAAAKLPFRVVPRLTFG